MTPVKFILRYTVVPLMAIVAVVIWASFHSSGEIDARQYAALSAAYTSFPVELRHDVANAMKSGKLHKWDYSSLVRESLDDGVVLDWPQEQTADVAQERARLAALVHADRF
ncbi:MAG TPA: hypothetical protein VEN30_07440 [Paraburkholderia sp.]|nr:hypothetical protein [Paraburkholderia sp.]